MFRATSAVSRAQASAAGKIGGAIASQRYRYDSEWGRMMAGKRGAKALHAHYPSLARQWVNQPVGTGPAVEPQHSDPERVARRLQVREERKLARRRKAYEPPRVRADGALESTAPASGASSSPAPGGRRSAGGRGPVPGSR